MATKNQIMSIQIFKKADSNSIRRFIARSLDYALTNLLKNRVWVFFDNATSHKSEDFQQFMLNKNVQLIFNAYSSPKLNLVGDIFEFLKREIRFQTRMNSREILTSLLNQAKRFDGFQARRVQQQQHLAFFEYLEGSLKLVETFQ